MMTPVGGLMGSGVATLVAPLGAASAEMARAALALLVTAVLVIILASRRQEP